MKSADVRPFRVFSGAEGAAPQAVVAPSPVRAEEYLSVRDLSRRIPYAEATIRNLMSRGVFRRGVHYVKPQGTGRPIFRWTAVQAWLEGAS